MIRSSLAFLAGILAAQQLAEIPDFNWLILWFFITGVSVWRRWWWMAFVLVGLLWAIVFAELRLAERLPEALAGKDISVTGVIANLPDPNIKQTRFDFAVDNPGPDIPSKIRISWYSPDVDLKAGQRWMLTVRAKPPHGSLNPGGFDYQRRLLIENIGATAYVRNYPKPVLLGFKPIWQDINVLRQYISDYLASHHHSALLTALTIGDGHRISREQWEVFRKTGTTHLIVISGSHIALVAGLVYWLMLKIWAGTGILRFSPQTVSANTACAAGFFYSALAGFSIPTQRAVLMLSLYMLAVQQQRHVQSLTTLAIAMTAVLILDPFAVFAPGFWLSFLAVAVIVYAVSGRLQKSGLVAETFTVNWATFIALAPFLLFYFQQLSLCAPLANLFAVPVISIAIVPAGLIAVVLLFIRPDAAELLFGLLDQLVGFCYQVLVVIAELPYAVVNLPQPPLASLLIAIPGILWLLAPKGITLRWLGFVLLLPLLVVKPEQPETGGFNLTLLDVGQGLAIAVQTQEHWLIYDTGAKYSDDSDSGLSVVIPFLRLHGVNQLNRLVVSHGDNDHIGGSASLLAEITTASVLTSVPEQLADYHPQLCYSGQAWEWDGVKFSMLAPPLAGINTENNRSCVLKIDNGDKSVLLTGDIEAEAESWLIANQNEQLHADILIAPHHGSQTSSTLAFLRAVAPDIVLISAGYRNQYKHPNNHVLARYQQLGIDYLNTAQSGAISINVDQDRYAISTQRETNRRYWHNTH